LDSLKNRFHQKEFRDSFIAEHVGTKLAMQIRKLREDRCWSQADLAERAGMKQSRISDLEDPNYAKYTMSTIRRLAAAFDVAFDFHFESYGHSLEIAARVDDSKLSVCSFDSDLFFTKPTLDNEWQPTNPADYARVFCNGSNPTVIHSLIDRVSATGQLAMIIGLNKSYGQPMSGMATDRDSLRGFADRASSLLRISHGSDQDRLVAPGHSLSQDREKVYA